MLRASDARPTPLVAAAIVADDATIRYEAAITVATLASELGGGGNFAYAGSSQVRRTLGEIIRLRDRPTAIIVETRPEVALALEQVMGDLGFDAKIVPSVARLLRTIPQSADLRLILSKVQLADATAIEMIDAVRRQPRGGGVPIAIFGEDPEDLEPIEQNPVRWDGLVTTMIPPASPAAFDALLSRIEQQRRFPELSSFQRKELQRTAQAWLQPSLEP